MSADSSKFAGSSHNKPGTAGADHLMPGAPATVLCPKCGQAMRPYTRKQTGEHMLQCSDRRDCNLKLPAAAAPAPDHGLTDLKPAPVTQLDGLAGLKTPEKLFGDDFSSPTASVT